MRSKNTKWKILFSFNIVLLAVFLVLQILSDLGVISPLGHPFLYLLIPLQLWVNARDLRRLFKEDQNQASKSL